MIDQRLSTTYNPPTNGVYNARDVTTGPSLGVSLQFRLLWEHVAEAIRVAIATGALPPGSRIVEQQIAEELNVSRAPVRDALRALVHDGLVTISPHRGAVVTPISHELIVDVFDVRAALEGLAARDAALRITPEDIATLRRLMAEMMQAAEAGDRYQVTLLDVEFHRSLSSVSGRPVLLASLEVINARRMLLINASHHAVPLTDVPPRHAPIIEALERGDADAAEAAARQHVEFGKQVLLNAPLSTPQEPSQPPRPRIYAVPQTRGGRRAR
jgi:DNA-binding GntR family transcriptional regulator